MPLCRPHRPRVRRVLFGRFVHNLQKAFKTRDAVLELLHKIDERRDRRQKEIDGHQKCRIIAEVDLSLIEEQSARNQDDDIENICYKGRRGMELPHRLVGFAARFHEFAVAHLEFFHFFVGIGERLGHADAGNAALQGGVDLCDGHAALEEGAVHLFAQRQRYRRQQRYARKDDERESHMDRTQIHERKQDRDRADEHIFRPMVCQFADVHEVVGHTAHELARFVRVEKAVRQRFQVPEHVAAHLRLHPHTHHVPFVLDEIVEQHAQRVDAEQHRAEHHDPPVILVRDQVV